MLNASANDFHKELNLLSQRLQTLKQDFRERGMISDVDQAILDRVQQEKDGLGVKLSDAERSGHWGLFKNEFGRVWNSFITDLGMLELRLMDAEVIKKQKP
jgi:hypothetical protein